MSESLQRWEPKLAEKADSSGRTALHHAASAGKTLVVKQLLLRNRSLAYIPDDYGMFAVHAAAIAGNTKVIREIMKICPSCDELVDKKQRTILHCAVERGRAMLVWHMCINTKFAGMMNAGEADGNTPLHLAIKHGHQLVFYFLMMNTNVDVSVMNNAGPTPRDVANYKISSDYTYSLVMSIFMLFSLQLCGAPQSYQAPILRYETFLEDETNESNTNYTNVSQSLLYISVFIAAGTFAAALAVPGGYIAEGENAGMPVIAGSIGLLKFVEGNAASFYFSTFATCVLVHGSLTTKYYTRHRRFYLAILALLVWGAVLCMLHTFTSAVRLSLYPSNCLREHVVFYLSVLVDVVVVFLGLLWPMLFFVLPVFLRVVASQLCTRRLSCQGMRRALVAALLATLYVYAVVYNVKYIIEDGLSPTEESCEVHQSGSWKWLVSYGKILFVSPGDEFFLPPT